MTSPAQTFTLEQLMKVQTKALQQCGNSEDSSMSKRVIVLLHDVSVADITLRYIELIHKEDVHKLKLTLTSSEL